jgi:predicted nucleic acid-binding protein
MPGADVVLVDTGPLVALFDPSDRHHAACRGQLDRLRQSRLVTSLAVLTEVTFLLGFSSNAQTALQHFIAAGAVDLEAVSASDLMRTADLMARYQRLPMDFADATLVVLAERLSTVGVFTLDRRDFSIYRVGRRSFRLLPPS